MLKKLRAGFEQIGGAKVVLATLAIAWGLKTIQSVVEETTERLAMLQVAENDAREFLANLRNDGSEPVMNMTGAFPDPALFDMDVEPEENH